MRNPRARRLIDDGTIGEILSTPAAREIMARRAIDEVYRLLGRHGISQRRIAALVGCSQSEVSEIIGGRRVTSVDVLERIGDGLGVPRGWFGVAHNDDAYEPPSELENELKRIDELPFPEPVRIALVRAVITGMVLATAVQSGMPASGGSSLP